MRLILISCGAALVIAYAVIGALLMNNWAIVAASGVSLDNAIATMHAANEQYSLLPGLIFSTIGIVFALAWAAVALLPRAAMPTWAVVLLWASIIACGAPAYFFTSFGNMNSVGDAFYDWDAGAAFSLEAPLYVASLIATVVAVASIVIGVIKSSSRKQPTAQLASRENRGDAMPATSERIDVPVDTPDAVSIDEQGDAPIDADRIRSVYAAPYYLAMPTLDDAEIKHFVELATSVELDEVLWMLNTKEWRCRKAGAWFALVRTESLIDDALRMSLLNSTDGLSSPDLAVCLAERLGAAGLPALLEYESSGTHGEREPQLRVSALITALGGTPAFDDATESVIAQVAAMRETARRVIAHTSAI